MKQRIKQWLHKLSGVRCYWEQSFKAERTEKERLAKQVRTLDALRQKLVNDLRSANGVPLASVLCRRMNSAAAALPAFSLAEKPTKRVLALADNPAASAVPDVTAVYVVIISSSLLWFPLLAFPLSLDYSQKRIARLLKFCQMVQTTINFAAYHAPATFRAALLDDGRPMLLVALAACAAGLYLGRPRLLSPDIAAMIAEVASEDSGRIDRI